MSASFLGDFMERPMPEGLPSAGAILPPPEFTSPSEGSSLVYHLLQLSHARGCSAQFVGAHAGEGTSTMVRDLSLIAASLGMRVLLLDLSYPRQGPNALLRGRSFGGGAFTEYGPWQARAATSTSGLSGLRILQLGQTGLFVSDTQLNWTPSHARCAELFANLRTDFDLVLVDTPPLTVSADALLFAQHVTTSVLVMSAESTRLKVIEDVRNRLIEVGGHIAGIALNKRRFHIPKSLYNRL